MTTYSIKVTDSGGATWTPRCSAGNWTASARYVVRAQFDGGNAAAGLTKWDTHPRAWVMITETDEVAPGQFAVIELPENGDLGGIRTEFVPAFMDVIARATRIAAEANERIKAEQAERNAAVPVPEAF